MRRKVQQALDFLKLSPDAAKLWQSEMAQKTEQVPLQSDIKTIAGVDVAYCETKDILIAGMAILDAQTLICLKHEHIILKSQYPYIPGLFSLREMPAIVKLFQGLKTNPDLIVVDGHGMAHPRRFGLACHLGLAFNIPTFGCAKNPLMQTELPNEHRGDSSLLIHQGEVLGKALRTQTGIKPVYISIGHKITLEEACQWTLKLTPKYRLPETTRQADQYVNQIKRKWDQC